MNRRHLGNGVYAEVDQTGFLVISEGEEDDRDNYIAEKAIVLEPAAYLALVEYVATLTNLMPQRSQR